MVYKYSLEAISIEGNWDYVISSLRFVLYRIDANKRKIDARTRRRQHSPPILSSIHSRLRVFSIYLASLRCTFCARRTKLADYQTCQMSSITVFATAFCLAGLWMWSPWPRESAISATASCRHFILSHRPTRLQGDPPGWLLAVVDNKT